MKQRQHIVSLVMRMYNCSKPVPNQSQVPVLNTAPSPKSFLPSIPLHNSLGSRTGCLFPSLLSPAESFSSKYPPLMNFVRKFHSLNFHSAKQLESQKDTVADSTPAENSSLVSRKPDVVLELSKVLRTTQKKVKPLLEATLDSVKSSIQLKDEKGVEIPFLGKFAVQRVTYSYNPNFGKAGDEKVERKTAEKNRPVFYPSDAFVSLLNGGSIKPGYTESEIPEGIVSICDAENIKPHDWLVGFATAISGLLKEDQTEIRLVKFGTFKSTSRKGKGKAKKKARAVSFSAAEYLVKSLNE